VRKTAVGLLEAVLSEAAWPAVEPLYGLLAAHLSCALTHIQPAIQRDGLRFIDALSQVVYVHYRVFFVAGCLKSTSEVLIQCCGSVRFWCESGSADPYH
jgi:hypothetical protein